MSRKKLTIIVTCTDRKSATPADDLMVRHLPQAEVPLRTRVWRQALARATDRRPLMELYSGETWAQVRTMALRAAALGYEPNMFVASAGLGLQSASTLAPSYSATFSTGHGDSVGASVLEAQAWWNELPHAEISPGGRAIWVLSEAYSRVVSPHLLAVTAPSELLVFGGSRDVRENVRVPADRSLRRALGGTVTSINVRSAVQWLNLSAGDDPFASAAWQRWRTWTQENRHREVFDRRPLSDSAVLDFISELRTRQPSISKTIALKVLREAGMACEQRRFSTLFQQVVAR
jgi:hypothetical protein